MAQFQNENVYLDAPFLARLPAFDMKGVSSASGVSRPPRQRAPKE